MRHAAARAKEEGIVLLLRNEEGETLAEIDRQRTAIGRDPSNDVVLEDPSVSGFHAVVFRDQGGVSIVDLGSTNGTALDGAPLRERTELKAWCRLRLGGVKLVVADTETREPTRVQPAVPAADPKGRDASAAQPTHVRPAARDEARASGPPAPADGIRFESLQEEPAGPGDTRLVPSGADSRVVEDVSLPAAADSPFALFGGYPRGLAWLLFSFRGRMRRSLLWKCWAVSVPVMWIPHLATVFALSRAGFDPYSYTISSTFYGLLATWPGLALAAKRIHDSGRGALPWCTLLALFNVLAMIGNWLVANRASQGALAIFGMLVLLASIPALYAAYLVAIKRGDDRDNDFGDQNPHRGIVLGG